MPLLYQHTAEANVTNCEGAEDKTPLWDDKEMQDYLMRTMNIKNQQTGDMN